MRFAGTLGIFVVGLAGCSLEEGEAGAQDASGPVVTALEKAYEGRTPPESAKMLSALVEHGKVDARSGWFERGKTVRSWPWLAERHGVPRDGAIPREAFQGPAVWFPALDRTSDGVIGRDDFDWSDATGAAGPVASVQQVVMQAASSAPPRSKEELIRSFFSGDLGSMSEGPGVGEPAPDFRLKTEDGSATVSLREMLRDKPVVLVFGSYTCDPFRDRFAEVQEVYEKFKDDAEFLFVYVREAHPSDGENGTPAVSVAQPKTYGERVGVAAQCRKALRPSMPLLVDEIGDPTGHAYSGMPSRLYVIAPDGTVAFKSGRGPFGFEPGEMEQALVLTLLDGRVGAEGPAAAATPAADEAARN